MRYADYYDCYGAMRRFPLNNGDVNESLLWPHLVRQACPGNMAIFMHEFVSLSTVLCLGMMRQWHHGSQDLRTSFNSL